MLFRSDLAKALRGVECVILAVPHEPYLALDPDWLARKAGGPIAVTFDRGSGRSSKNRSRLTASGAPITSIENPFM